jgi:hypothetical protein
MKKRILPIGLFSLLLFVFSAFLLASVNNNEGNPDDTIGQKAVKSAMDYLSKIRNNQLTGLLNPEDVINARQQIESRSAYKSGNSGYELNWIEMGPDNIGGRTRAILFDNRDANANTLYAGGVSGGIFKSTNLGSTWAPVNQSGQNLNVTSMVQDASGTIYVGTGEGMNLQNYSAFGQPGYGYSGGFIGQGIFKSDGNDNFQLVPGTKPVVSGSTIEWAYINKLALDPTGNRLFAATQSGLKFATLPELNDWQSECKYRIDSTIVSRYIASDSTITCDSFHIVNGQFQIYGQSKVEYARTSEDTTNLNTFFFEYLPFESPSNCMDVQVSANGWIIAAFNGFLYVSETGDPGKFISRSIYPNNQDSKRKDLIDFSTHIVIKNKSGVIIHDEVKEYNKEFSWHINYVLFDANNSMLEEYPSSANTGRISLAIAPSDQNIVYMMAAKSSNPLKSLSNLYLSEDKGQSWRIVAPGGTNLLNILGSYWDYGVASSVFYQGDYSNTLTVFPNDPYKILAGGVNMWEGKKVNATGFFQWTEKSVGDATLVGNGIFNPLYCHWNHHLYVFRPGTGNQIFAATDGGIYSVSYDGSLYYFQAKNKNFNVTQFYSVDVSGEVTEVIGGTQDNGTQYISGIGNTPKKGEDLWRPANLDAKYPEGTDGGFVALSGIRSTKTGDPDRNPPSFYTKSPIPKNEALADSANGVFRFRRSETLGYDWSTNFLLDFRGTVLTNTNFLTPLTLWESYSNSNSRDSVTFKANQNYNAGENIIIRSKNMNQPFGYILPEPLNDGDSISVQDIISTKLFFAIKDNVYMTLEGIRFDLSPDWYKISDKAHSGFADNPSCIAYSSDGNYVFVGNYEGKVYRISNIALAYNQELADIASPTCIIATTLLNVYEGNTQAITSIAVDPENANKVLVTLGNYGNSNYVFYSTNALGDVPTFTSVQGNSESGLPPVPVYSSILEMHPETDIAIVGTDEGIWQSDDVSTGIWYQSYDGMGSVPVMALVQQTNSKTSITLTTYDPVTNEPIYEIYPEIKNYGMIYAATHGRGIFRNESFKEVGIDEFFTNKNSNENNLTLFPNPASGDIKVSFDLKNNSDIQIMIYDLGGKMVHFSSMKGLTPGHQLVDLKVQSLSKGTYLVNLVTNEGASTDKLVIIK